MGPPAAAPEAVPPREPVQTPTPARQIQLEFSGDEGRVQVRLAENSGEVRVTVHSSDRNIPVAMREDLPGLNSRLEQAGFRAETWHGAALPPSESQRSESIGGAPQQDTPDPGRQSFQQQQQEPQQQQPRRPTEDEEFRPKPPTDFSWLFQSLR